MQTLTSFYANDPANNPPAQTASQAAQQWLGRPKGQTAFDVSPGDPNAVNEPQQHPTVPPLLSVIRPNVRTRWAALVLQGLTPERVLQILHSAFSGHLLAQWELFDLMEDTSPMLKKCLSELREAVTLKQLSVKASVIPGKKKPSPMALDKAALIESSLAGWQVDATRGENGPVGMVYDICDSVGKGLSVQEIYFMLRNGPNGKPAWLPRATRWVHPLFYGFPINDQWDDKLMLCPDGHQGLWVEFPQDKFIISRFKSKSGHDSRSALLRTLATFWMGANFAWDWLMNLAQMFGVPLRWCTYDQHATNADQIADDCDQMMATLGSTGYGVFPSGTQIEFKEAIQRAGDNPQERVMQIADTAYQLLILGQTLTTSQGEKGSHALGKVHKSVREERIAYVLRVVANTLNEQYVPAITRRNYGHTDEDPTILSEYDEAADSKAMAERDQILIQGLGMQVASDWLYERHEVPKPDADDEVFKSALPANAALPPEPPNPDASNGASAKHTGKSRLPVIRAKLDDTDKLAARMAEDLTGIEAKWLGGVKPYFRRLVQMANDPHVTDQEFVHTVERAAEQIPELRGHLNSTVVAKALEGYMTAGLINGAARGLLSRHSGSKADGGANP